MSDVKAELARAITTASNDRYTGPQTEKLARHKQRLTAMSNAVEEIERLRALLGRLILNACPMNWSDDEISALAWLEAERQSGEALPDEDYNGPARAELAALTREGERT